MASAAWGGRGRPWPLSFAALVQHCVHPVHKKGPHGLKTYTHLHTHTLTHRHTEMPATPPRPQSVFLVYDLETTGFDVCKDKIVQLCILVFLHTESCKLQPLMEFCSYVNPGDKRMSRGATRVTGLTTTGPKGKVLRQAKLFKQMWTTQFMPQYRSATKHLDVQEVFLVGHNSKAIPVLNAQCLKILKIISPP